MMTISLVALNEIMAFLTLIVCFPGATAMDNRAERLSMAVLFFLISVVWPVFLIVSPIAFFIMWKWDGVTLKYWSEEWPWRLISKGRR